MKTIMKWNQSLFKILSSAVAASFLLFSAPPASAVTTDSLTVGRCRNTGYERRLQKREDFWHKLMPDMTAVQFAGNIGMISAGVGWDYGKANQWETHVLIGFLPHRYNSGSYWTFTVSQKYLPWKIRINDNFSIKPLSVSLGINSILHGDFWMSEPERYPKGYYGFASRMRFVLGIGQRVNFHIPENRRWMSRQLSLYYEITTCDLYVRQKFLNSSIPMKDLISLGIGAIFKF